MTSPTKAPPHLRTGRGLPACTKHPTDGGYYRRFSARAHPRPIPLVEPVTTAVLPFRIPTSLSFVGCMPSYRPARLISPASRRRRFGCWR